MSTTDEWAFLHDLIFGSPHAVLTVIEVATAVLIIAGLSGVVVRFWRGDRLEIGPLKVERPEILRYFEASVDAIAKDDRLKRNVLWTFRERLSEAGDIIDGTIDAAIVRKWCRGVLTDIVTTLGEGGDDRHRASVWIKAGDRLRMFNGVGFRQEAVDRATLPMDSIAGTILRTGKSHNAKDVDADNAFAPKARSGRPYKSLLAVPIRTARGRTIGTLCVDAETENYFDADHEFFAGCFADLIALLAAHVIAEEPL